MTKQQVEALQKLTVGPAVKNAPGRPLGIAYHADGYTLNGNLLNALMDLGLVTAVNTGRFRTTKCRYTKRVYQVEIIEFRLTPAALTAK